MSSDLADLVGEAVSAEINRREVNQLSSMASDDERRFARSVLRKELRRRNEAALTAGHEPLALSLIHI